MAGKIAGSIAAAQNAPLTSKPLFIRCRITSVILQRNPSPRTETIMALSGKGRNQPLKQTSRPITLKPSCCGLGLGASIDETGG
jgi:hypothetical protein